MKSVSLFLFSALFMSLAFGARPVARWDVVPWQRVSGVFNAGVVAFHESGVKVEFALRAQVPPEESMRFCHALVHHGRACCSARAPRCTECFLKDLCKEYKKEC